LSNPIDLRRSFAKGSLVTGILYGVATLVVLAFAAGIVGLSFSGRRGTDPLAGLERGVGEIMTRTALLSAEPSRIAWDRLVKEQASLEVAVRSARDELVGEATELGRIGLEVLPDRFARLTAAVDRGLLDTLGRGDAPAADLARALPLFHRPLADYLRALADLRTEAGRAVLRAEERRLQGMIWALIGAAAVALAGLLAATGYLVGFVRVTALDARALAVYGEKMARGDYPGVDLPVREDALGEVATALRRLSRLEKALYDVRDIAAGFQGRSASLDAQLTQTVAKISVQSSRVEAAVTMLDDIVQAIQSVHTNARRSLDTAEESGQEIERSIEKLLEGARQVAQLETLTSRIEEIVSLISSIADQTDILSLNAGIEAARAGPSGRGFTVVATEVRKLADKSGRSALEISELTQSILSVVQKIASRTEDESFVMSAIQKGLARIAEAVGQVTAVSGTARDNVERLSSAIDEITGLIIESQREVGEIAKTVKGLRAGVDALRAVGSDLGFSVPTASFAAWAADEDDDEASVASVAPRVESVRSLPAEEPRATAELAARVEAEAPEVTAPIAAASAEEQVTQGEGQGGEAGTVDDEEELAELEPVD
jgi:methyl-accepting chemotaxis protein